MTTPSFLANTTGLVASLKRYFFFDQSALDEIRDGLSEIQTEYDRQRTLRLIDSLLAEAQRMRKSGVVGDALDFLVPASLTTSAIGAIGYYKGMRATVTQPEISALSKLVRGGANAFRGMFGRDKVDYSAADLAASQKEFARGVSMGYAKTALKVFAGLAAIACIIRVIHRNGSNLPDYIIGLTALRKEVAAMKLPDRPVRLAAESAMSRLDDARRVYEFMGHGNAEFLLAEVHEICAELCGMSGNVLTESGDKRVRDVFAEAANFHDALLESEFTHE